MNDRAWTNNFLTLSLLICIFAGGTSAVFAQEQDDEGNPLVRGEHAWLIEKLKTAKPAPTPPGIFYIDSETASPEQRQTTSINLITGEELTLPATETTKFCPWVRSSRPTPIRFSVT